jgi:site-specific DNA-cytosine methylase
VIKQGYIERNFHPKILFRDVREFIPEDATTATTAYGAVETIPAGLDMLIAGFVCKDLSQMNNSKKSLDSGGASGDTFRAIYTYADRFRPKIVLLENVKDTTKIWEDLVAQWDAIGYDATWDIFDTKNFYLPQTRLRMYMIAIDRESYGPNAKEAGDVWQASMLSLKRQCSSPYEAFLADLQQESSSHSALLSEHDWALCKLRYDHIRSKEQLGTRPLTRWHENGTIRYVLEPHFF